MICKLCRNKLDPAHCESMYGLNPKTLKKAWFHIDCGVLALLMLSPEERELYESKRLKTNKIVPLKEG